MYLHSPLQRSVAFQGYALGKIEGGQCSETVKTNFSQTSFFNPSTAKRDWPVVSAFNQMLKSRE